MKLIQFRVQNYRSVLNSGDIIVSDLTSIVGRNESGKTNLLRALYQLNPHTNHMLLDYNKDFPVNKINNEIHSNIPVVNTFWSLDREEQEYIGKNWPEMKNATTVKLTKCYNNELKNSIEFYRSLEFKLEDALDLFENLKKYIEKYLSNADKLDRQKLNKKISKMSKNLNESEQNFGWFPAFNSELTDLHDYIVSLNFLPFKTLYVKTRKLFDYLNILVTSSRPQEVAEYLIKKRLPTFIYVDDYPIINGTQNIEEYLQTKDNTEISISDHYFGKMCKVAEIDLEELARLSQKGKFNERTKLLRKASKRLTDEIRRLWKNQALTVRFHADGNFLVTYISDSSTNFDHEVELNERSHGFQWFFSFYISLAVDSKGKEAKNVIFLLDEPGLHLHAKSQRDLLTHLTTDFRNQILYTTHSQFMIPTDKIDSVRVTEFFTSKGTISYNDVKGDSSSLLPLQAALGYDLAQNLFISPNQLVVEGITDYWILSSISDYLNEIDESGLNKDIPIIPAGSASKVPTMVTLLSFQNLNVVSLLDSDDEGKKAQNRLTKDFQYTSEKIILIADAIGKPKNREIEIENLLEEKVYENLVDASYSKSLGSENKHYNKNIPRITKRFERAFEDSGKNFYKTKPTKLLLKEMAINPEKIITPEVKKRAKLLFKTINKAFDKNFTT